MKHSEKKISPNQTLYPLPTTPPLAFAEDGRLPSSPAISSSSTVEEEEGAPSPVLPPLPEPKFNGHIVKVSSTRTPPPSNAPDEQSNFFTASWGSPYQTSHSIHLEFNNQSQSDSSEEDSPESPIHNLPLHTSFLRPAPLLSRANNDLESSFHERLISAAVLANRARRRKQGLTEDWIRKHTCGKSAESSHWLSDGEQSDISSLTGSGHSSENNPKFEEQDPQTPTLKTYLESIGLENPSIDNRRKLSVSTLRQEDFYYDPGSPRIVSNSSISQEKAMDTLSHRPQSSSSKTWQATALPSLTGSPISVPMSAPIPRVKKKIQWHGKHVVIFLPIDVDRGKDGNAPFPMTEEETQNKIKSWEDMKYDTRGFDIAPVLADEEESDPTQSRPSWPIAQETDAERLQKLYKVSVPDRREWDRYVQELQEAKLRSLGVSLGDEDSNPSPFTKSAIPSMGRRASIQYPPLPYSPPIPPTSATSSNVNLNSFSQAIIPGASMSTYQGSHPVSVSSPLLMNESSHMKYNHHSISFSTNDHPFGSPFQFAHQPSQTSWSPGNLLQKQGIDTRGRSPSMQNLGTVLSPIQTFSTDGYFPQTSDTLLNLQRKGIMQTHITQPQTQFGMSQASPRLREVEEHEDEENQENNRKSSKTPDKWQPPNDSSKTMTKEEIDDAEYHLEGQIQRELEHDDYSPHSEKSYGISKKQIQTHHIRDLSVTSRGANSARPAASNHREVPFLHHPQPHSRSHSFFQENTRSSADQNNVHSEASEKQDVNTEAFETCFPKNSADGTHNQNLFGNFNPWHENKNNHHRSMSNVNGKTINHRPKASISKLNVAAKEFTLNPTSNSTVKAATAPLGGSSRQSVFLPQNFQPLFNGSARPPVSAMTPRLINIADNAPHVQLNYNPPVFIPAYNQSNTSTTSHPKESLSSYNPQKSLDPNTQSTSNSNHQTVISVDVDPIRIPAAKSIKNSKAIPIVRPDTPEPPTQKSVLLQNDEKNQNAAQEHHKKTHDTGEINYSNLSNDELNRSLNERLVTQSNGIKAVSCLNGFTDEGNTEFTAEDLHSVSEEERKHDINQWSFQKQKTGEDPDNPDSEPFSKGGFQFDHKEAESSTNGMDKIRETKDTIVTSDKEQDTSLLTSMPKSPELKLIQQDHELDARSSKSKISEPQSPLKRNPIFSHQPVQLSNQLNFSDFVGLSGSKSPRTSTLSETINLTEKADKNGLQDSSGPNQMPLFYSDSPKVETTKNCASSAKNQVIKTLCVTEEAESHFPDQSKTNVSLQRTNSEEIPELYKYSSARCIKVPDLDSSSPIRFLPDHVIRSDAPSPSPKRLQAQSEETNFFIQEQEDLSELGSPYNLNCVPKYDPASEWDDVICEAEGSKVKPRAQFFDNHVNIIVGGILAEKLGPLESALGAIRKSIDTMVTQRSLISQDHRSISGTLSDADDEDDEIPIASVTLRRERRLEQFKTIVQESIASSILDNPQIKTNDYQLDMKNFSKTLDEIKIQLDQQSQAQISSNNLPAIIKEVVEQKFPSKLFLADGTNNARITDLESKLGLAEARTDEEVQIRRAAEDRLSEIQRQLRISSEEEHRLRAALEQREARIREILDESDAKVRSVEADHTKCLIRISVLEAADENEKKIKFDLRENIKRIEEDLRNTQLESQRWRLEAERVQESERRYSELLGQANDTTKDLRQTIEGLKAQSEESIRVREVMRGKLIALQEDMAHAAREITEEDTRRIKKEQELIARQEVLDARLQAEGRTRERLECEIDRLEKGERDGLRAVGNCKKLESLVDALREENNLAKKDSLRYQRELEVAKESAMGQAKRNRKLVDAELDAANERLKTMRENFERQIFNLRTEIHQARLDSDNARAKNETLIEEAEASKNALRNNFDVKLGKAMEDLNTQHKSQLQVIIEESRRHEKHLIEQLSLSSAKTEHFQDRIAHLEDKLEIANAAVPSVSFRTNGAHSGLPLREKISPQALRESILSLQEQIQERESTIESLKSTISNLDPEANIKISKRDDEIMWLRELLAVRKSDLTDVVQSLEMDQFDVARVKDAAIRLRTSLQMQEQELERAINGGSALPNLAASLREVTTPRVAQAVGPLVAVWDSWRKAKPEEASICEGGTPNNSPSRGDQNILDVLLSPPTSITQRQPKLGSRFKVFGSSSQRFSSEQLANRPRIPNRSLASQKDSESIKGAKELEEIRNSEMDDEVKTKANVPHTLDQLSILIDSNYDQDATEAKFKGMSFYTGESSVQSVET